MIEHYYCRQFDLLRLRSGPLGPYIDSFTGVLEERGYRALCIRRKLCLVAALNRWLSGKALKLRELNERLNRTFLKTQRKLALRSAGEATLRLLLRHLRERGVVATRPALSAKTDKQIPDNAYERFLIQERGFAQASVPVYLGIVERFLSRSFPKGPVRLSAISPKHIIGFILEESRVNGRKWVQLVATVLRSFLGFLYQHDKVAINLAAAVPAVPVWRLSELPRFLESAAVERLLKCCDQSDECGRRDYAVLLLLARLGLRASEVVNLNLEDINWASGELVIKGKGGRVDRLPLMRDVGQAMANYLRNARPKCSARSVFIRLIAPRRGFSSSAVVDSIVDRALTRANLHPANRGAHVLRHSLATRMLRSGASLAEIGQVLGHRHSQTTEIYAKVDLGNLRALAQPWPGGAR